MTPDNVLILAGSGLNTMYGDETFHPYTREQEQKTNMRRYQVTVWGTEASEQAKFFDQQRSTVNTRVYNCGVYLDLHRLVEGRNYFVATSNMDGGFAAAGFSADRLFELNGNIHHSQCLNSPDHGVMEHVQWCGVCGMPTRPNMRFFDDLDFVSDHADAGRERFDAWLAGVRRKPVQIYEVGAGFVVPALHKLGNTARQRLKKAHTKYVNLDDRPQYLWGDSASGVNKKAEWHQESAETFFRAEAA